MIVARSLGVGRGWELVSNGYRVSVGEKEKVLKMDGGDGCKQCECT